MPKPVCPECGCREIRHRVSQPHYRCRRCGWEGDKPVFEEKEAE